MFFSVIGKCLILSAFVPTTRWMSFVNNKAAASWNTYSEISSSSLKKDSLSICFLKESLFRASK